jgi:hypothetical protein
VFAFFLAALTLKYALGSPEVLVTVQVEELDIEVVFTRADCSLVPVLVPVLTIRRVSGDFRLSSSSWSIFSTSCSVISPFAIPRYRQYRINIFKKILCVFFNLSPVEISSH